MSTESFEQPSRSLSPKPNQANQSPYTFEWSEDARVDVERGEDTYIEPRQLAQALGWFSIGLGLAELLAPRALGRAIGVGEQTSAIRLLGLREIASGLGLLSERGTEGWAWARVGGDVMDLALLGAALRSPDASSQRIAMAATAVVGVTALDIYASRQLHSAGLEAPSEIVIESLAINSTPQALYAFWKNVENLPRFMYHLESVTAMDERTSHWVAKAPAGTTVEWDSEIVRDDPDAHLSWQTVPGSEVTHQGTVSFEPAASGRGTIVRVQVRYIPPAGRVGVQVARLFGEEPRTQIKEDLRRLKQLIETGEVATTLGQPTGRRSLFGRATLGRRVQ